MSITSDELNYLIHRYLQESGFTHSAFAFGNEACVNQSNITPSLVPPGALISIAQKGLQFVEAEMSITSDGKLLDEGLVEPLSLIDAVRPDLGSRALRAQVEVVRREVKEEVVDDVTQKGNDMDTDEKGEHQERPHKPRVSHLKGHESEVFICAWNPQRPNLLASGSGDSTARIWDVDETSQSQSMVLRHPQTEYMTEGSRGVTTLDWNWDGSLLATGAYDGIARVWSTDNSSPHITLSKHQAPIFVLKWSPDGNTLVSGGVDKYVVVWDPKKCDARFQLDLHTAPTLDIDWRSSDVFASCSSDRQIKVCQIDSDSFSVLKTFHGHMNEVNAIKWDPSGTVLASCSDDKTTKIWSLNQSEPLHELKEHKKGIYTLRWSPSISTGPRYLATGSFDSTVRLWDINVGKSVHTFTQHREAVYSVVFSPDGRFIASGSFDKWLHIWAMNHLGPVLSRLLTSLLFALAFSPVQALDEQGNTIVIVVVVILIIFVALLGVIITFVLCKITNLFGVFNKQPGHRNLSTVRPPATFRFSAQMLPPVALPPDEAPPTYDDVRDESGPPSNRNSGISAQPE